MRVLFRSAVVPLQGVVACGVSGHLYQGHRGAPSACALPGPWRPRRGRCKWRAIAGAGSRWRKRAVSGGRAGEGRPIPTASPARGGRNCRVGSVAFVAATVLGLPVAGRRWGEAYGRRALGGRGAEVGRGGAGGRRGGGDEGRGEG